MKRYYLIFLIIGSLDAMESSDHDRRIPLNLCFELSELDPVTKSFPKNRIPGIKFNPIDSANTIEPIDADKPASRWATLKPKINPFWLTEFNTNDYRIRTRHLFNKSGASGTMAAVVVHGTILSGGEDTEAGPHNPNFFATDDVDNQNYRNCMNFCTQYGDEKNHNIELLSFRWPGSNVDAIRQKAAYFLTGYLKHNYPEAKLLFIAHSHGCNVVNLTTQMLNRNVELIIHNACPAREMFTDKQHSDYRPKSFTLLLHFYSTSDIVATLGAIHKHDIKTAGYVTAVGAACCSSNWSTRSGCSIIWIRFSQCSSYIR